MPAARATAPSSWCAQRPASPQSSSSPFHTVLHFGPGVKQVLRTAPPQALEYETLEGGRFLLRSPAAAEAAGSSGAPPAKQKQGRHQAPGAGGAQQQQRAAAAGELARAVFDDGVPLFAPAPHPHLPGAWGQLQRVYVGAPPGSTRLLYTAPAVAVAAPPSPGATGPAVGSAAAVVFEAAAPVPLPPGVVSCIRLPPFYPGGCPLLGASAPGALAPPLPISPPPLLPCRQRLRT